MDDHDDSTDEYVLSKNLWGNNVYDSQLTEKDKTTFDKKERKASSCPTESQTLQSKVHYTPVHSRSAGILHGSTGGRDITALYGSLKQSAEETIKTERNQEKCSPISDKITETQGNLNDAEIEVGEEAVFLESGAAFCFNNKCQAERSVWKDQANDKISDLNLQRKDDVEIVKHIKMKSTSTGQEHGQIHGSMPLQSQVKLNDRVKIMDVEKKRPSLQLKSDYEEHQYQYKKDVPNAFRAMMHDMRGSFLEYGKHFRTQKEEKSKWHSKKNARTPEAKCSIETSAANPVDISSVTRQESVNSLEDALTRFGLWSHLQKLENSLEDVRRRKKTEKEHEVELKKIDKELQKLSFQFHPDKMKSRVCTEEELAAAHSLQAALNATRTVFNTLTDAFLSDLSTDHKYGFYTKLNITSLGNENQINSHIYEVLFKIGMLSEIKQRNIIAEIGKFLKESKCCVESYLYNNLGDFTNHRDAALYHLKCCIGGYKSLNDEYKSVEKQCKHETFENISTLLYKMASENLRELDQLKRLKKVAKVSLAGNLQLYDPLEDMDDYLYNLLCVISMLY